MKAVDANRTVYELTEEYPELVEILGELGFAGVTVPVVRRTVGRTMTLAQGAARLGISLERVREALRQKGFSVAE